jgi:hypothetical protein
MRNTDNGKSWSVEELPDSVLETVRALVLADDAERCAA